MSNSPRLWYIVTEPQGKLALLDLIETIYKTYYRYARMMIISISNTEPQASITE